ncbi:jasmonate-induced oxygenase 4-like isoform X1 [Phragmites australis]|uniref:jasmonate-induced oxygenase 4-like isoform X1 n=1 Tax=Phragmites australis TaxID=29695 RepID=UPI002D797F64|nr:jasmonate-induced oxygenase 4-like isoform X1 [Phragmites australis]
MEGAGAGWPEPVVRVQSLSESGAATIPERYVKPEAERPALAATEAAEGGRIEGIPVVDLSSPCDPATARAVSEACREWGFFQAVNHGVPRELLRRARGVWRGFFHQPMEVKQRYANSPATYEGYGSRLGVEKGAVLDWGDYYFVHVRPPHLLNPDKWPHLPPELRETTEQYSREVAALCERLMAAMSAGLGVGESRLQEAFGGAEGAGVCVRVNYYPQCPQPELTLGLSSHSDPGGMTVLLADDRVRGLQVRRRGAWVTVDPIPDAFIVNVGDQIQACIVPPTPIAARCTRADECDVPERGAPRGGERRPGAAVGGALLQPQERPPAGAHAGARLAGAAAGVQAHDLRRVPPLHPPQGAPGQEPGQLPQSHRRRQAGRLHGCLASLASPNKIIVRLV